MGCVSDLRRHDRLLPVLWAIEDRVNFAADEPRIIKVDEFEVLAAKRSLEYHHTVEIQVAVDQTFLVNGFEGSQDLQDALGDELLGQGTVW